MKFIVFILIAAFAIAKSARGHEKYSGSWKDKKSLTKPIIVDKVECDCSTATSRSEESTELEMVTFTSTAAPRRNEKIRHSKAEIGQMSEWEDRMRSSRPRYDQDESAELRNPDRTRDLDLESERSAFGATIARQWISEGSRGNRIHYRQRASQLQNPIPTPSQAEPNLVDSGDHTHENKTKWTTWPRMKMTDADNWQYSRATPTPAAATATTRPAPRLQLKSGDTSDVWDQSPRLDLKSGDNVQFGDRVSWSIFRSETGITRIGKLGGEIVVRIFRPHSKYRRTTEQPPVPIEGDHDPEAIGVRCQMGQDCYNRMLNYANYGFHLDQN